MFIRKRNTPTGGESYSLLESVRTPTGPRHRVVACLGGCATVAEALAAWIVYGERELVTLAIWQGRPKSPVCRKIRATLLRIEKQIAVLTDALALTGGTQAEVEGYLPESLEWVNRGLEKWGLAPIHATEATDRWLRAIADRLAGAVTIDV
jgi:hypothetical protein